ncbi:MAG: nitroreductase [Oscillospiraceae bacterium]|nr:nitroreductase [Oscillospiraceae bacterium]
MSIKNEVISKRKSVRKYDSKPLLPDAIQNLKKQIEAVTTLFSDIKFSIEIEESTKGIFGVKAPHYLIFRSEQKDGYLLNTGFIGQLLSLYLSEAGIGSCWLGMAKPEGEGSYPFVISMAFGTANEDIYRKPDEFKRKPLSEISEGDDTRLEAVRLAPSGMNSQNWYFVSHDSKIDCYIKSGKMSKRLSMIDMGIALAHIYVESANFAFSKAEEHKVISKYEYVGTVI